MNSLLKGSIQLKEPVLGELSGQGEPPAPPPPPRAPAQPRRPPRQRRRDAFQLTDPELHIHTFLMNGEDEEGTQSGDEEGNLKRGDDTSEASSTEPAGRVGDRKE